MITYWVNPKTTVAGSLASYSSHGLLAPQNPGESTSTSSPNTAAVDRSHEPGHASTDLEEGMMQRSFGDLDFPIEDPKRDSVCPKLERSITFISGVLQAFLRQIVARRLAMGKNTIGQTQSTRQARMAMQPDPGTLVLDEMEEIISMPKFDAKATRHFVDPESVELPQEVIEQLHSFVTVVALMYQGT